MLLEKLKGFVLTRDSEIKGLSWKAFVFNSLMSVFDASLEPLAAAFHKNSDNEATG